jgi:preprotein translocase SecE subunit
MHRFDKYINALFLAAGGLVWLFVRHYTLWVSGYFQLGRKMGGGAEVLEHALPILVGVITFFALRKNTASLNFTTNAVSELVKVSWPSAKDVRLGTIVVIITVIVAGIVLGFLDMGINASIRAILGA